MESSKRLDDLTARVFNKSDKNPQLFLESVAEASLKK
jgi:hypothetical protein